MSKTYTRFVQIECWLPGYHKDFELHVEVEFSAGDVNEIHGVRVLADAPKLGKPVSYVDAGPWLLDLIERHLDIDCLIEDVEPDDGPDPDDERDRRIDEALMYGDDE